MGEGEGGDTEDQDREDYSLSGHVEKSFHDIANPLILVIVTTDIRSSYRSLKIYKNILYTQD